MFSRIHWLIAGVLLLSACSSQRHQVKWVLLPDTQTYAEKYPHILEAQIKWVLDQKKSIDFVLQQGDLTQNNNHPEWKIVAAAFHKLNHQVPYTVALGNHDMGSADGKTGDVRNTSLFNQYFVQQQMASLPHFGASMEPGKMDNVYYQFSAGKLKWLVLTLEFGPSDKVLDWANKIVAQHPNHTVILNTHAYMYSDSTRIGIGDKWRPQAYGLGKDTLNGAVNDGDQIWNKLVRKHANIRFVFSGHILNSGVGTLVSVNDYGSMVFQMLANFQQGVKGSINGGNGWLRILDMDMKKRTLRVTTYSPHLQETKEDPAHQFLIRDVNFKPR